MVYKINTLDNFQVLEKKEFINSFETPVQGKAKGGRTSPQKNIENVDNCADACIDREDCIGFHYAELENNDTRCGLKLNNDYKIYKNNNNSKYKFYKKKVLIAKSSNLKLFESGQTGRKKGGISIPAENIKNVDNCADACIDREDCRGFNFAVLKKRIICDMKISDNNTQANYEIDEKNSKYKFYKRLWTFIQNYNLEKSPLDIEYCISTNRLKKYCNYLFSNMPFDLFNKDERNNYLKKHVTQKNGFLYGGVIKSGWSSYSNTFFQYYFSNKDSKFVKDQALEYNETFQKVLGCYRNSKLYECKWSTIKVDKWKVKYKLGENDSHQISFFFTASNTGHVGDNKTEMNMQYKDEYSTLTTDDAKKNFVLVYARDVIGKLPSALIKSLSKIILFESNVNMADIITDSSLMSKLGLIRIKTSMRKNYELLFHELGHFVDLTTETQSTNGAEYYISLIKDKTFVSNQGQKYINEDYADTFAIWCLLQIFIAVYKDTKNTYSADLENSLESLIKTCILSKNKMIYFDKLRYRYWKFGTTYTIDFLENTTTKDPSSTTEAPTKMPCNSIDRLLYVTKDIPYLEKKIKEWMSSDIYKELNRKSDIRDNLHDAETLESRCKRV